MNRETFRAELRRITAERELTLTDIARRCKCARPTAQRWLDGTATPHVVGRQSVIDALEKP